MYPENVKSDDKRKSLFPAMLGAGISLFLLRTGVFAFFFLVPFGFVFYKYKYRSAWAAFLFAVLGNTILAAGAFALRGISLTDTLWDICYFGLMSFIFTGILAPPPVLSVKFKEAVRFFFGSCLGALLLTVLFLQVSSSPVFLEYLNYLLSVVFQVDSSLGTDAVQGAMFGGVSAEVILGTVRTVMLCGGSLVSCVLLFAICRQIGFFLASFTFRKAPLPPEAVPLPEASFLAVFRVNPVVIWVFSVSLFLVVLTRITRLEIPEIILWNILILCVILYFTQGLAILRFFLSRFALSPFTRVFLIVVLVIVLFSPFLNALLLGGLFLLGVVENWVPLRAPKKNGPPSTPEAGNIGG